MWTKGQLVRESYGELSLAGFEFELTPDEIQMACRRLDAMMATWDGQGIRLGYAATSDPKSVDPDTDSGLPDWAVEAVYMNLAMKVAAAYGKTPMRTTAVSAKQGYDMLLSRAVSQNTVRQQFPGTLPRGAGNKWGRRVYMPQPTESIDAGPDGPITFN